MKITGIFLKYKFLLFFAISFLLYGNTLKNSYALDDAFVTTSKSITSKGLSACKEIFTTHYVLEEGGTNTFEYRPMVKLSFAIEHQFFGVNPSISHFFNILLYAVCLNLLFIICLNLFQSYTPLFPLLIVILFAFIPMHTEVVASLKNRDILIAFIFAALCFKQLITFIKNNNYFYLFLGWLFLSLSFLSKLDTIPFIIIIPVLLFYFYNAHWKQLLIILITLIVSFYTFDSLMNILINQELTNRPVELYENPLFFSDSFTLKLSTALNSIGFYIKMLVVPLNMASYYGYNTINVGSFLSGYSILGMITLCMSCWAFLTYIKEKKSPVIAGLIIFFISLSMYLNVIKAVPGIVADRFAFIPSIGFSIIVIYLLLKYLNNGNTFTTFKSLSTKFKVVFLLLLMLNFIIIIVRNGDWKNSIALYINDCKAQPKSLKLHNLCGNEIIAEVTKNQGLIPESKKPEYIKLAESSLKKVLQLDSNNIKALNNLSFIYQNFYKNYGEAKFYILKAYRKDSLKYEVAYNLALCNYYLNNTDDAKKFTARAFMIKPTDNQILELMSEIYSGKDYNNEGIHLVTKKLQESPQNFKLNLLLGNLFIAKSDTINAIKYLKNAYTLQPNDKQLGEIIRILSK